MYHRPVDPISAFVLAGGKSTRMGSDKAFLGLAGRPLIAHALTLAQAITPNVTIVGDPAKFGSLGEVIEDAYPGRGPLAGIHAALSSSGTEWNLILAVDLPFVEPDFLAYLLAEAQAAGALVTLPFADGHLHPLCAVYHRDFLKHAERALLAGENKIEALFGEVPIQVIGEEELAAARFDPSILRNLNTPSDWEQARRDFPSSTKCSSSYDAPAG